jgi:hypothetical protein
LNGLTTELYFSKEKEHCTANEEQNNKKTTQQPLAPCADS